MLLNHAQVESIASNCLFVKQRENGRAELVRFTDKQMAIYDATKFPGAHCAPCACFDFTFEGDLISFEFQPIVKTSRNFIAIDLYDGETMVYSLYTYADAEGERRFFYRFPTRQKRRVRIFLPFSADLEIFNFVLEGGAFTPTQKDGRMQLLLLGDSITHGYDTHYSSMSYAACVARHFDAVALNQAVGGYFFNADMIDPDLPFAPDVITVAYGTNDWGRYGADTEKYHTAAKTYIDKLCATYPNAKIFGILPVWRSDLLRRPERMPFDKVYEMLIDCYSAHDNVTIIDGREAVPNLTSFYTDGLHPNTIGQLAYAQYVISAMEKAGVRN